MNIKNKIRTLLLTLMVFTCGCTQYLELDPLGQANGPQIWGNAAGNRNLLSGTYSLLRRTMLTERPFYLYSDLPSQTVLAHNHWIPESATKGDYIGAYLLDWWVSWEPWYKVITSSNTLLKHINDVPDADFNRDVEKGHAEKKQIEAEANFLYAYTYFWLVRIYGDVPLAKEAFESVDQGLDSDNATIGRKQAPEKEILEYLIKRLDAAIPNMEYAEPGSADWAVRADKSAALALKAHICTWLANRYAPTDKTREKELLEIADDCLSTVIAQSGRSLVDYDDPDAVTKMFMGQSSEGIFELNVSFAQNESYWMADGWHIHGRSYWRESFKEKMANPQSDVMVADMARSTALYPEVDIRRTVFFENFGNGNGDKQLPPVMRKYGVGIQEDMKNSGRYYANANVLLLRLTDTYLLRAEVLCKLGRTGNARNILDEIRNRSHIGSFTGGDGDLIKGIFEERARELVGEGHSAFDRIRNNYWSGCSWWNKERDQKKGYYWPVRFETLLSSNRDLVQVPFWAGKL